MMPKLIYPGYYFLEDITQQQVTQMLRNIERAYRLCYKSEGKMPEEGFNEKFLRDKIAMGHETPLEHEKLTFGFVVDRGVTHEMVRHRIASPTQESTRYCNYDNGRMAMIIPGFWDAKSPILRSSNPNWDKCYDVWYNAAIQSEQNYNELIRLGATPQEARSVLLTSVKTEIVITMNFRELRHFFKLRAAGTTGKPHPQMLEVVIPFLKHVQQLVPVIFDDIQADF